MNNVSSMSAFANDATLCSPEQVLEEALQAVREKRGSFAGKKLLVLALDDGDERWDIAFKQAGMSMSECIALVEGSKILFFTQMGYLPE